MPGDKIAVVTVHGTGDTAEGPEGTKWFQQGSQFTERLRQKLSSAGFDAEIIPVLWSGANSAAEREKGADKLTRELKRINGRYASVHVIGHSHGGNVANEAAVNLRWGLRRGARKEPFASLTTVGTPFLDVRTGLLQKIAGLAFFVITWGSALMFPIVAIAVWFSLGQSNVTAFLIYLVGVGASLLFMLGMSRRGARRIMRPQDKSGATRSVFAIWHDNDEAISFLRRIEELPIEAFPRGALFRGSRAAATSWGVLAVLLVGAAFPIMYMMGVADVFGIDATPSNGVIADVVAATTIGLIAAPAVFVLIYGLYRYGIGGVAELGARGPMNGFVSGVLRGIAMGRDGDQVICNVSTDSHTHGTDSRKLDGEVASRMRSAANASADKLVEKYRWSLFTIGSDTNSPLASLATDAMTWDSLIHTTYFDQPEIVDMIAAHIAANAGQDAAASAAPVAATAQQDTTAPSAAPIAANAQQDLGAAGAGPDVRVAEG